MDDHGIPYDETISIKKEYSVSAGREAMGRLFRMTDALTAVLCGNDILAFGAMAAVRNEGYIVGVDVSITGFDDLVISRVTDPPLKPYTFQVIKCVQ